jgi:hypothetical protein
MQVHVLINAHPNAASNDDERPVSGPLGVVLELAVGPIHPHHHTAPVQDPVEQARCPPGASAVLVSVAKGPLLTGSQGADGHIWNSLPNASHVSEGLACMGGRRRIEQSVALPMEVSNTRAVPPGDSAGLDQHMVHSSSAIHGRGPSWADKSSEVFSLKALHWKSLA